MQTETLISLYESFTGSRPEHVEELPGAGSNRRYFRMKGPQTLIGVIGTSNEENHAFLTIDRHFKEKNLPVPEVYAATEDESCYLQEDLGNLQLFKAIEKGRLTGVFSEEEKELLRKTLRMLPRIQFAGADGLDFSVCYPQPEFNRIDFQGGRKGPFYYDVASFLWQAKANLPDSLRMELVSHYIDALREYKPVDETYFKSQLRHFVLFRTLQVLGAYGFRGYFEKKPHFIQSVPFAVENLRQLLKDDFPEYPYLCQVLHNLTELKQFTDERKKRQLTVKVMSFAYKKGIPEDPTGNGGGYVFDCRAVNNPGKYDRYKPYTGLDENVIRFLEEDGEITRFLEHVYALVDAHVQRYIERGFTNLSVCFGCTGGQHRSVYSAQHVAEHISRKFGVKVQLIHREQNIEQIFEAR